MQKQNQSQSQRLSQSQKLQQKLSPQQIQYIKLLQLPTIGLEQRIKEELELNPILEEASSEEIMESTTEIEEDLDQREEEDPERASVEENEPDPVDENEEIDWESFLHNTEYDGQGYGGGSFSGEEWKDLPNPYHETLLEELESQVSLLDLDETDKLIADQILGSLDSDGYFRRDPEAVVDNISFNHGELTSAKRVDEIRRMIQQLEPVGIASKDLRDCLIAQLQARDKDDRMHQLAVKLLEEEWEAFERKHFSKLKKKLDLNDSELRQIFDLIKGLDPKPGSVGTPGEDSVQYIEPDFEVYFVPGKNEKNGEKDGEFVIRLNQRNVPSLRISPHYKEMWNDLKKKREGGETKTFIRDKIESAQWFIESIRQRQQTLLKTMRTIVTLQEEFFKHGDGLKPMILKDIAERINLDISTISRVVNGKYVQTGFGVFELKYFFSEGLQTESGEEVSSHEVKRDLEEMIKNEDKDNPLSDQQLTKKLKEKGYKVARRTVSKYREQLNLPVARLRKQLV